MKKYLYLQLKRVLRLLPFVLGVCLAFLGCIAIIFLSMSQGDSDSEDKKRFKVAICGDLDGTFLGTGISAITSMDSSRFTIEIIELDQADAHNKMQTGEISAYAVIPEGFIENAIKGVLLPIKYVTVSNSNGIAALAKNEITSMINNIVVHSQKAVYGIEDALWDNGHKEMAPTETANLSLNYINYIIERNQLYRVTDVGLADGLGFAACLFCGLSILLISLMCLPFCSLYTHKSTTLFSKLYSSGIGAFKQTACEYMSFVIGIGALVIPLVITFLLGNSALGFIEINSGIIIFSSLLALLVATSLTFFIYTLCDSVLSGILISFFAVVSVAYISGCIYPVYTFPVIIQRIANYFPLGAARHLFSGGISHEFHGVSALVCLGYSVCFFVLSVVVRWVKIKTRGTR